MTSTPHEEWTLVQEPDHYSRRMALWTALIAMIVILGVVVITDLMLHSSYHGIRWTTTPLTLPAGRAPREIGGVKQTLIGADAYGQRLLQEQRSSLERYDWTDRQRGIVSVPVEQGMRMVIQRGGK